MRIDVMTDIETLGTDADSTIIQIGAIAFDIKTGEHLEHFVKSADITKNDELKVSGSTLKWWLDTDKELLHSILSNNQLSSRQILTEFYTWLIWLKGAAVTLNEGELHMWGNGILFDNNMIKTQFEAIGFEYPIHFRNDRDMRTLVDLAAAKAGISESELKARFKIEGLRAHDALDDCTYQVALVSKLYQELTKEETQ